MGIKEEVRSREYINKFGLGHIKTLDLSEIFLQVTKLLTESSAKAEYLLYPIKPREIEARYVMCEVLKKRKYSYMIESPIQSPTQKVKNRASFVDLSIYTKDGIIDIEFKRSPSDIKRDFPKLLCSQSIGCGIFYLFNGKRIDRQFQLIIDRYRTSYENAFRHLDDKCLIEDKWLVFFLLAYEEGTVFSGIFESIRSLDFTIVSEKNLNRLL